jgi:hypothetical protein
MGDCETFIDDDDGEDDDDRNYSNIDGLLYDAFHSADSAWCSITTCYRLAS